MDILRISSVAVLAVALVSTTLSTQALDEALSVEPSTQFVYSHRSEKTDMQFQPMTPRVGRIFEPVLELFQAESSQQQFEAAVVEMKGWDIDRWNAYEKAMYWRYLGGIQASLGDYQGAAISYQQLLAHNAAIPVELEKATLLALAKFEVSAANWDTALEYLRYSTELGIEPTVDELQLQAVANYQVGEFSEAIDAISQVISIREAEAGRAQENNYNMQVSAYMAVESNELALVAAQRLVEFYPSDRSCRIVEQLSKATETTIEPVEACVTTQVDA